jgi:hypothetical protein
MSMGSRSRDPLRGQPPRRDRGDAARARERGRGAGRGATSPPTSAACGRWASSRTSRCRGELPARRRDPDLPSRSGPPSARSSSRATARSSSTTSTRSSTSSSTHPRPRRRSRPTSRRSSRPTSRRASSSPRSPTASSRRGRARQGRHPTSSISEAAETVVRKITFIGNQAFSDEELRKHMLTRVGGYLSVLSKRAAASSTRRPSRRLPDAQAFYSDQGTWTRIKDPSCR